MFFHRSNRAERLLDALAELMRDGSGHVFAPESIVVQSRGMERWVSMELSQRLGIWANSRFPFPRAWLDEITDLVLPDDAIARARFNPEALQWSIAALLPTLIDKPALAQVAAYLRDDPQGQRALDLSRQIARVFDQYVVFRPKLIAQWESGQDADDWQAVLWRAIVERQGAAHAATRAKQLERVLSSAKPGSLALPRHVSFFAISTLPPLYIDMLSMLARHIDVHWFLLSPSNEYWVDIRPQREIWSALHSPALASVDASELHLQVGHPLLASWGRVGKDLLGLIEQRCSHLSGDDERYEDPGLDSALHVLQSDILALRARGSDDNDDEHAPLPLADDDNSIAIHACHSEMREVEVLHDQLCGLLEADHSLSPQDILVMAPDIDRYAPLIDAVFSRPDDPHALAYQVSERKASVTRPTLDAFNAVLEALASRMPTSTVLDLLNIDLIRARFGIGAEDLEQINTWVIAAGARWAVDEEHRAQVGQPALRENTWRFAFDRLLLGVAIDGEGHALIHDVLPYDDMEGNDTELLGRLATFCDALFSFRQQAAQPQTLSAWRELLSRVLSTLIDKPATAAADHRSIHEVLDNLVKLAEDAAFAQPVTLASIHAELRDSIERGGSSHGFLSSGITFCRMVPMRSVPFRVIALLGMNNDGFPRPDRHTGFDRSAQTRQPGDRSARDDDRQLLLETVLSARSHLIATYVGQSIQDNSTRPPSVLIGELLDWCAQAFTLPQAHSTPLTAPQARDRMRDRLVTQHPLQPWSPRYFNTADKTTRDLRLFSFASEHAEGSRALAHAGQESRRLFPTQLQAPPSRDVIDLRELEETINDPLRTLLQQRLGVRLGTDAFVIDDREPMALDALDNWQVASPLIELALRDRLPEDGLRLLRAGGSIPLGSPGAAQIETMWRTVERIAALSRRLRATQQPASWVDVPLDGARVQGVVRDRFAAGTVLTTYSKLSAGIELRAWVRHLALNASHTASAHERVAHDSYVVGRDDVTGEAATIMFPTMSADSAREQLQTLLSIMNEAQLAPSVFDRKRARAYAVEYRKSGDVSAALAAAHKAQGEFELSYYSKLAFNDIDPLERPEHHADFARLALAIYSPLLDARVQA